MVRGWDYETKQPRKQLTYKTDLLLQVVIGSMCLLWFYIVFVQMEFDSVLNFLLVFGIGTLAIIIVSLVGIGLGAEEMKDVPYNVYIYNYKITLALNNGIKPRRVYKTQPIEYPSRVRKFSDTNKKTGQRYAYWKNYG